MAGKTYAQIGCGIAHSKKVRALASDTSRWLYICIHTSPMAGWAGMFSYPRAIMAHDIDTDVKTLDGHLEDLRAAGLIEYDNDEEYIRLTGWHRKHNGISNASQCAGRISDFESGQIPDTEMRLQCVAEFCFGALERALKWKDDSADRPRLMEAIRTFLSREYLDQGDDLLAALATESALSSRAAQREMRVIFPALNHSEDTVSASSPHPVETRDGDETDTIRKKDRKRKETEICDFPRDFDHRELSPASKPEGLRNGDGVEDSTKNVMPLAVTMRTALVRGRT